MMEAILTYQENVAVITLNRVDALNALNAAMINQINVLIEEVRNSEAHALVFVGAGGKAFCAGADVKELLGKNLMEQKEFSRRGQLTFAKLDNLPIPSIAVVGGVAFGGGLELALACTFRVATLKAKLGLPEVKLGVIPGYGGTQRLSKIVGPARAMEIIATGRTISAEEADRIGLVTKIDDGEDHIEIGMRFASALGTPPPGSLNMIRRAVAASVDMPLAQGLELEADLFAEATQTADAHEGIRAFIEKRKPQFGGA